MCIARIASAAFATILSILFAFLVLSFCGTGCAVQIPPTEISGLYHLKPDGGTSGTFTLEIQSVRPVGSAPDAGSLDSSTPQDSGVSPSPDASTPPDLGVPDSGLALGVVEPACCSGSGYSPPGKTIAQPVSAKPSSAWVSEPAFGTQLRATAPKTRHEYSQLQAWNASEQYVLLRGADSRVRVHHAETMAPLEIQMLGSGHRWRGDKSEVLWVETWPEPRLVLTSVPSGAFRKSSVAIRATISLAPTWEATSRDGRLTAVLETVSGSPVLSVIDLDQDRRIFERSIPELCGGAGAFLDWVAPTPSGDGFAIQWGGDGSGLCRGFEVFGLDGTRRLHVHDHHHHADLGTFGPGQDFLLTYENAHPANGNHPSLARWNIQTGVRTDLRMIPWGRANHFSCQSRTGACLISATYDFPANQPLLGEVFLLNPDGSLRRLVHHRSTGCSDYYAQPHGTLSPSARRALFASTWGVGCAEIQSYEVRW